MASLTLTKSPDLSSDETKTTTTTTTTATLTQQRIEKLKSIGFVFHAKRTKEQLEFESQRRKPTSDLNWYKNFEILKEFKKIHGHTLVPKIYKDNQTFSSWVYTQRHLYKKKFCSSLSNSSSSNNSSSNENENDDGSSNNDNREEMKRNNNGLTDERIQLLNSIDFVWNAKKDRQWRDKDRHRKMEKVKDLWQKCFDELVEFKKVHGKIEIINIIRIDYNVIIV